MDWPPRRRWPAFSRPRRSALPPELLSAYARLRADCGELERDLEATLADDLPLLKRDGGFVRPGALTALDEARSLRDESRRVIAELQASYANEAGVRQLKIKHNNFLGYYIETPQAAGETLLKPPEQRDLHPSSDNGRRDALHHQRADRSRVRASPPRLTARSRSNSRRSSVCARPALAEGERLRGFGGALAEIDVAAALAELAVKRNWTRPLVDASLSFTIEGGRHPVVEAALGKRASRSSPMIAIFRERQGRAGASRSSPAPTWRANRLISGRTR